VKFVFSLYSPTLAILLDLNSHTQNRKPWSFPCLRLLPVTWLHHFWFGINVATVYSPGEPGPQHLLGFFLALQRGVWEINLRKKNKTKRSKGSEKRENKLHKGTEVVLYFDNSVWLTSNWGRVCLRAWGGNRHCETKKWAEPEAAARKQRTGNRISFFPTSTTKLTRSLAGRRITTSYFWWKKY